MSDLQDPSGHHPPSLPTNGTPGAWKPQVLDPLTQAFEVMIARITSCSGSLLRYWIAVAFTIFLATCGRAPFSISYSNPNAMSEVNQEMEGMVQGNPILEKYVELILQSSPSNNLPMLLAMIVIGTLIALIFRYFSSRFEFILIAQVAEKRAKVGDAWERYRDQGHSLFSFHAIVLVACSMFNLFATFIAFYFFPNNAQSIQGEESLGEVLSQIGGSFSYFDLAMLPLVTLGSIFLFLLGSFVLNFVVPIMYRQNKTFLPAWSVAFNLFVSYPIAFIFYLIMRFLVFIVGGLVTSILGVTLACVLLSPCLCLTCFVPPAGLLLIPATIFMIIFYMVFALLLSVPMQILLTAYSLKFLEQFGEGFDFFTDNSGGWQEDYPPMAPVPYSQPSLQQGPIDPPPHP